MNRFVIAVALLAACRGDKPRHKDAGVTAPALSVSVVAKLPLSPDGTAELRRLDQSIERATRPAEAIRLRLERAAIRGMVDDYQRALADATAFVAEQPRDDQACRLHIDALLRVHHFAAARTELARLDTLVKGATFEYEVTLADATGDTERALAGRQALVKDYATADRLTLLAITLAQAGRVDEALALVPKAAAAVHNNTPQLISWLLFQWGRLYELKGEPATARDFFAAARARLPGYLEATTHLAQTLIATGDRAAAKRVVTAALETSRHPELLALAAELGSGTVEAARTEWERYVTALPLAFSDHAARFYLGIGRDPARALELARINHRNRDTHEARALVVEAALAAGDPAAACAVVDPLVSSGTRAQRFVAWQALAKCGRPSDADRLARDLGIVR